MLAWVRTGVTLMGLGFVVARFGLFLREIAAIHPSQPVTPPPGSHSSGMSIWIGTILLIVGVGMNLHATIRFAAFGRRFRRGDAIHPPSFVLEFTIAVLLGILGLALAAHLISTR